MDISSFKDTNKPEILNNLVIFTSTLTTARFMNRIKTILAVMALAVTASAGAQTLKMEP